VGHLVHVVVVHTAHNGGEGRGAEHSALSLLGSHSHSVRYLRTIIPRRPHRWRGIGGAEAEVVVVAGRGGSGGRGSGDTDNRVMFCVVCCGAGENYCVFVEIWCEWIFLLKYQKNQRM
jgi:hypothetical protein